MLKKLLTIFFLAACASLFAADPSEQFLTAYQAYQQGEKAERDGNATEALKKYRFAESVLVEITTKDPAWQKSVIEYRLKKTREGVERLQAGGGAEAPVNSQSAQRPPAQESSSQGPSITVVPPAAASEASNQQKSLPDSSAEVRRLKKQLEGLKSDLQEAREALTSQKNRSKDLDSAKWVEERTKLEKDLLEAKDQVATLSDRLKKRDSWEKDIKDLQRKLDDALADKAATEELYQQREKKMADAASELAKQLEEARRKVAEGSVSRQKLEGLSKEVENGRESLKQLQGKLEQAESKAKESLAKNTLLQDQVSQISEKLAEAQKQSLELDPLRAKLKALQDESATLKSEVSNSRDKLAVLEKESRIAQGESAKREASLTADLQVVEEERRRISEQVAKLAEAAREASRVKILEKEGDDLRKSVASLQDEVAAARKDAADALARAETSEKSTKAMAAKLASAASAAEADKVALEEERARLSGKLAEAAAAIAELGKKADAAVPVTKQLEQLQGMLAENSKALESATSRLAAAEKALSAAKAEAEAKALASLKLKEMLEQQNASLQTQLNGATERLKTIVEKGRDSGAMQEQIKKMQEQITLNAKNYEDSQRKLAEISKERPELEKALKDREKSLADAKNEAEKLRADLSTANQKVTVLQEQTSQGEDRLKKLQDQLAQISQSGSVAEKSTESVVDKKLEDLGKEGEKLRAELATAKQTITSLQGNASAIKALEEKLSNKESELARLRKSKGKTPAGAMADQSQENSILRGIVIRQVKEEARRAQARRLMDEEMKRLNIQSQTLTEQIAVLSAPSVELTPEERALFKDGQLVVADNGEGKLQASVAAPKSKPVEEKAGDATPGRKDGNVQEPAEEKSTQPQEIAWQGKFKESIARAKTAFERQDFQAAENSFREALGYSPDDYFALSNLGVVEFQLGKFKEAEELLQKATQKTSDSSFALTTLGIVHYRQERLADAEKVLRKAITVNQQDYTAHNYLGIVLAASGKGAAGESEIMKALEINPQYADAHFNLAVIYATGKPPAKMMAKKHYAKAIELGAPPDPSLERLIQ